MNAVDMLNSPWAIQPEILTEMCAIYAAHRNGESIDIKAVEAAGGRPLNNTPTPYNVQDGVAIIPVEGVLSKRLSLFQQICGGASYQSIQNDLAQALADPNVSSVVLSIDSPGGAVDGVQGTADAIYAARSQKPIVAFVDGKAASAAYWLGSSASKLYIGSDTDQVGSIGVVTQHIDTSNAEHQRGVKITDIAAGRYKAVGSQHAPLSAQDRNTIQDQLDQIYGTFVDTVARNRGTSVDAVLNSMADGRVFIGQKAIDAGLADGKTTLPALIQQISSQRMYPKGPGAVAGVSQPPTTPQKGIVSMEQETITSAQLEAAKTAAYNEGLEKGATAERKRIQAVESALLPGHEKLIAALKSDGKTTGPEAAAQIVAAEKELRTKNLASIQQEAPKPVPPSAPDAKAEAESNQKAENGAKGNVNSAEVAVKARELVRTEAAAGRRITYAAAVNRVISAAK